MYQHIPQINPQSLTPSSLIPFLYGRSDSYFPASELHNSSTAAAVSVSIGFHAQAIIGLAKDEFASL
ncbi:hypothetical protein H5410_043174 [Solanum commersonii]|uniref:Uncharacterized protein n=1 Tax=Solanum commersonii TaxID=4109 RepID=A0A9J5XZW1_SOLCO|nr:hypothetical protein H5410_043174 [Solanum commersonii]